METEAYKRNINGIVGNGFVAISLALGEKLGIFDALKKASTSLTAGELAMTCNMKQRYVEEWLGGMVAARVVLMDDDDKYYIPENCKSSLVSLLCTPWYFIAGLLYKKTMECFDSDGPQGYTYKDMPIEIGTFLDGRMQFDQAVGEMMVPLKAANGKTNKIIEIGSGFGALSRVICKLMPDSEYIGLDQQPKYVNHAIEMAKKEEIINATYLTADAEHLPTEWTGKFDWAIMFDVLHDLAHPKAVMGEVCRVLKNEGVATIVDPKVHSSHRDNIGDLAAASCYSVSGFFCLPCSSANENSAKHGAGWGFENKQDFLEDNGWEVRDKNLLCEDPLCYAFTCVKKS